MKKSKAGCDLQTCYLCRLSMKEWKPAIGAAKTNIVLKKGEVLFSEDEEVKGMYFVYDGTIKVHKKWGDDKDLLLRFATKGDIVGHRGIGSGNVYPVSATALESSTVCYVDLDFFNASLTCNQHLTQELLKFYAQELYESEKNMRNLAHMPVKGRLANAFLSLRKKFGETKDGALNIELSRQDLASYTGATYETVFRILNEMLNEGLVEIDRKKIILKKIEELEGLTMPE
ncbi:Crp/Fnr family transcriptional regulator [Danxiaibacter flavus]|uniref:Crp/Fnr family transcriptional regulator n=1 Tax=Danxiaibacter flavus TaxID=3049108 RepID=A0ABV3Z8K8_9BACT|nr:Crp/Fnr family transcriptional regulator [Chitinophagaceae bacterium DXS]